VPSKKPPRPPSEPDDRTAWLVILEDIQAKNRMTLEAVHARADSTDARLTEELGKVHVKLDVLDSVARGHGADIRDLKDGVARVETKVDKIDTRLQVVEIKVEKLDERLQVVEVKVDKVDARLQVVETKVEKLDERLQVVEVKVDKIDARLQVVETKVDKLDIKVEKIDTRLQTVEMKVDILIPLEGRVSALERRPA
jgi:chromosome segregation ATPase